MDIIRSDLTVAGGGIAGMCAALAAARHGLKVALINDRPVLGGNASSEVGVSINGACDGTGSDSVYARETGLVEEIKLTRLRYNQTAPVSVSYQDWPMEDAAYFDLIYREPNIRLFLNTSVRHAEMRGGRVAALLAVQTGSERECRFESPLFVDATGDGTVASEAGASFMWGEEARDEFHEPLAPQVHTRYVMGSTILIFTRDAGRPVVYRRPDFAYDITKLRYFSHFGNEKLARGIHRENGVYCGYWWIEVGGLLDTVADSEAITLELRRLAYGVWDYIKNSGHFEGVDNLLLEKVTRVAGKRESRRFVGDYVVTENDIEDKTDFPDAVSVGGWSMDVHAPNGIYDDGPSSHWHPINGMYNLPLRAMYARDVPNLFLAGRDISCTHIAMGSTRVMGTCAGTGQAVGTAAWLCGLYRTEPAGIVRSHMPELQQALLRDDQTIMGKREDTRIDLLQDLTVTSSPVREFANTGCTGFLEPDVDYCLALPAAGRLESLEIRMQNAAPQAETLTVSVCTGRRPENYIPDTHFRDMRLTVPGGFDGWLPLPVEAAPGGDRKLYLMFRHGQSVRLGCGPERLPGAVTFRWAENAAREQYPKTGPFRMRRLEENIGFRGLRPEQPLYEAATVVNGYARPYGLPNLWMAAMADRPWLKLEYAVPKSIGEIQLVCNTALEYDNFRAIMPSLIKSYRLEITYADGSVETADVRDNWQRVCRHRPGKPGVVSLRFTFQATHGSDYAQVYAVRLC